MKWLISRATCLLLPAESSSLLSYLRSLSSGSAPRSAGCTRADYKLKAYTDLLNAVTEINLAGADSYKMDIAKKNLALTLNRLNLIASSGVLKSVNDLLDFLNEHKEKDFDTLRLHNILNTLVIEARRDLNPSHARRVEESRVRYRFFAPLRK